MPRVWTEIGKELLDVDGSQQHGHNWTTREHIEKGIAALTEDGLWCEATNDLELPMSPGLGIAECIKQFKLPKVSQIAIGGVVCFDNVEAPGRELLYGLYGIVANYKDVRITLYVVDRGVDLVPVAIDEEERADAHG